MAGVALLIAAALTIPLATGRSVAGPAFLVLSLVSLFFATGYVVAYRFLFITPLARARSRGRRILLHAAALLTAAALGGGPAVLVFSVLSGSVSQGQVARILGIGLAVLTAVRILQLGYEGLEAQVHQSELREERARLQAVKSELAALQARTDPHFLFNSLNTLAGLIEEDPERAVAVVTRLGGFFRHNLQASCLGGVSLGEEIRAASAYLEIQTLRFGDRIRWEVDLPPDLDDVPVPALCLQPLVENAVVHGTKETGHPTRIEVRAERSGNHLLLTVDDDGPGPGGSAHRGSATSITDLAKRIRLLYGGDGSLETGARPRGGFRARLVLPVSGYRWPETSR